MRSHDRLGVSIISMRERYCVPQVYTRRNAKEIVKYSNAPDIFAENIRKDIPLKSSFLRSLDRKSRSWRIIISTKAFSRVRPSTIIAYTYICSGRRKEKTYTARRSRCLTKDVLNGTCFLRPLFLGWAVVAPRITRALINVINTR